MSTQPSAPISGPTRISRPVQWVRDLPIWTKLGLIMLVPTIATIVVGTAGLFDQVQQANSAERARTLSVLSGDAGVLVHRLQDERAFAMQLLTTQGDAVTKVKSDYSKQQQQTDTANAKYRVSRSTVADIPDNLRGLLDRIESQLGELPVLRADVEGLNKVPLSITERRYQVLIADLLGIRDFAAQLTGDSTVTDRMRAASAVATEKEFLSQERVVILKALADRQLTDASRRAYIGALAGQDLARGDFAAVATPDQQELLDRTVSGEALRTSLFLEGQIDGLPVNGDPTALFSMADWDRSMVASANQMETVESALNAEAQNAASQLGDQVQRRVQVEFALLLMTMLLGALFAWMVARSIRRSLRDLRQGALAVAQYGLPQAVARLRDPALPSHMSPATIALQIAEPLPVRSKDEFGQVTEAFNAVHLEAVRTAAEQAALRSSVATMFVNLARRSQILVDRLIGHLDRLERGEQDPDRLSELFQLDHLATRMRRNDENLLVLAGADSTRVQREPAALMDVLRASQSEVEHYTRIEFAVVDQDIEIAAHAVNDLVHLIAELFDNATAFSPPDTAIRVEARRVGDRAVLQVEDRGIGMSPEQYAELNDKLATPPMVDVAVSRMMGLVVVARLASRHAVKVELRPAQGRGTIADVLLPGGVLVPRALAGRTQSPAGFPAARPAPSPGPAGPPTGRSLFGPPLALESSPGGSSLWPSNSDDSFGGSRVPPPNNPAMPTGAAMPPPVMPLPPIAPQAPTAAPSSPGGPPAGGGLGAALAHEYGLPTNGGSYTASGLHNAGNGNAKTGNGPNGRSLPAWYDLTGAGAESAAPTDQDPLPHRRQRDDAEPGAEAGPDGASGVAPSPFASGPPPAARPPVWPPVSEGTDYSSESVPGIPETLSASLDMTSELPRMRSAAMEAPPPTGYPRPDMSAAPAGYSDDMTMELPIFRELESAWFRPEPASLPSGPVGRVRVARWGTGSAACGRRQFRQVRRFGDKCCGAAGPDFRIRWCQAPLRRGIVALRCRRRLERGSGRA